MRTTLIALLCLVASSLRANLVDLTPGGWDWNAQGKIPPALEALSTAEASNFISFFDEARVIPYTDGNGMHDIHGWVSQFGVLNGGTYFNTNLFSLDPTANAGISWNFSALPGYSLGWLTSLGGTKTATHGIISIVSALLPDLKATAQSRSMVK